MIENRLDVPILVSQFNGEGQVISFLIRTIRGLQDQGSIADPVVYSPLTILASAACVPVRFKA